MRSAAVARAAVAGNVSGNTAGNSAAAGKASNARSNLSSSGSKPSRVPPEDPRDRLTEELLAKVRRESLKRVEAAKQKPPASVEVVEAAPVATKNPKVASVGRDKAKPLAAAPQKKMVIDPKTEEKIKERLVERLMSQIGINDVIAKQRQGGSAAAGVGASSVSHLHKDKKPTPFADKRNKKKDEVDYISYLLGMDRRKETVMDQENGSAFDEAARNSGDLFSDE